MNKFTALNIPSSMTENLDSLGYKVMTKIQEESLPHTLKGKDLIGKAKTGSGKTAAFGIALLLKQDFKSLTPKSLVLCPTRELADQVAGELRKLARFKENVKILTLYGGSPMKREMSSLKHGAHIIVGTPGRIIDHLGKETLDLKSVETAVLDEADKMLDMGFYDDIAKILSNTPKSRQTLLFSATMKEKTKKLAAEFLKNPVTVQADTEHQEGVIKESFYSCDDKQEGLVKILKIKRPASSIVFANTKAETETVADFLEEEGFDVLLLNGNLEQYERDEVMIRFANKSVPVLVATDVASRGLDIADLDLVVNYDFPDKPEIYTHRIGRTARAGKEGEAVSLFSKNQKPPQEQELSDLDLQKISNNRPLTSDTDTLCINGGKKSKVRKGDVLGTLIKDLKIAGDSIGKIDITDRYAYVALSKKERINIERIKIKGKSFKVWVL